MSIKSAVVLFSGGLDSTTVLAWALREGYACYALSFDYGQRHRQELDCAREIAAAFGVVRHAVVEFDLKQFGGSALTDKIEVPKSKSAEGIGTDIPVTYVPARNTIFLSFALAWAETLQITEIFIGVNAMDYSGYPDCRPAFIHAFEQMANLATKAGVQEFKPFRIQAPLMHLGKAEIIRLGTSLGVDYGQTMSCYDPIADGRPCGQCDACWLRAKGFSEAGVVDPLASSESVITRR